MTEYINLNSHVVSILTNNQLLTLPGLPKEKSAKIVTKKTNISYEIINNIEIPIYETEIEIENLPEPQENIVYIVNSKVATEAALKYGRTADLLFPDHIMRHPVTGEPLGAPNLKRINASAGK